VTYNWNPYPNANVAVHQKGTFTDRTYNALTDQDGKASIVVTANAPEAEELDVKVSKDSYNYSSEVFTLAVGITCLLIVVIAVDLLIAASVIYLRKHRKRIIE